MSDGWFLLKENPATGISTWGKFEDDGMLVQTRQDVSVLLDANRAEANLAQAGWGGDYHRVARLPASMMYENGNYIGDAIRAEDDKAVTRWLNDSDNIKLRTKEGNV